MQPPGLAQFFSLPELRRIRPRDEKHPVLFGWAESPIRIQKDKMLLQVEDVDSKEREYSVVSMTPRHDK